MAQSPKPSMVGYHAAMEWLFEHRPHMMEYIAALGAPKNDMRCSRAMVVAGPNFAPRLYTNDEWLQEIGPASAAGVLVHEWRHVMLGHHAEGLNPKPQWRYSQVLRDVHEVVINDSLELTGYQLTEDAVRGENRGEHFYGYWTTDEAYGPMEEWYLAQKPQDSDEGSDDSDSADGSEEDSDESDQSGSSSGNGSGSSSESEDGSESDSGSGSGSGGSAESEGSESDTESGDESGSSSPGGKDKADSEDSTDGTESDVEGSDVEGSGAETGDGSEDDSAQGSGGESGSDDSDDADADSDGSSGSDSEDSETELPEETTVADCDHGTFIEDEDGLREMTESELEKFVDKLNELVADAIRDNPMPEEEKPSESELDGMDQDVAEAIDPSRSGSFSKSAGTAPGAVEQVLAGGKLQLGWLKLLQKINPDVGKSDGGFNAKASYNWARPRRSTSLVKGALLPSAGEPRGLGVGTKQKPVALIALDFSGSIDRRLAQAMKDMAQSIPSEHIEARCFTFSTMAVPFDFKAPSNSVASGGTDFSCIELEARKIQQETGEYPYVICLTDGEAWFGGYSYGGYGGYGETQGTEPTQAQLDRYWLWVDVLTEDDSSAFREAVAYPKVIAQKNKSALPYDRSKL